MVKFELSASNCIRIAASMWDFREKIKFKPVNCKSRTGFGGYWAEITKNDASVFCFKIIQKFFLICVSNENGNLIKNAE